VFKAGRVTFGKPTSTGNTLSSNPDISVNNSRNSSKRSKAQQYDISEFKHDIADENYKDNDVDIEDNSSAWKESGKLLVLAKVLPLWFTEGHKVLLFSQTHSMLNLLEVMMQHFQFRYMRLDGATPIAKRAGMYSSIYLSLSICLYLYLSLHLSYSNNTLSLYLSSTIGIIDTFNKDASIFIMLLTTRTGGLGISLTSANRVVLGTIFISI
jgi:DNA excision repair protein ERCC-6